MLTQSPTDRELIAQALDRLHDLGIGDISALKTFRAARNSTNSPH
jgi:hypothetical protein